MPEQTYDYLIAPKASFDATADAIRAMAGSQASITWGQDGFAEAIGDERRYTVDEILNNGIEGDVVFEGTSITTCSLERQNKINSFTAENIVNINDCPVKIFKNCTSLSNVYMPNLESIFNGSELFNGCTSLMSITNANFPKLFRMYSTSIFANCTNLELFCVPKLGTQSIGYMSNSTFEGCTKLETVDMASLSRIVGSTFKNCTSLNLLIFRKSSVFTLDNVNAFTGTPFASGGTGGTIYIPKTLYDALGTGTNDYKAATNWSVLDGYGTITWAKIEGSQYENYYADGTPIPTT